MAAVRPMQEQTLVPPQPQPWRSHHRRSRRPPSLMEELIEEILLRLPRASLVHAALVCKPWHRLVSSPRFKRRFLEFHNTPPMLGFICNYARHGGSSFVRTAAGSTLQLQCDASRWWAALDSRHGRILLRPCQRTRRELPVPANLPNVITMFGEAVWVTVLKVWDPITDEVVELPGPPRLTGSCTAAVLCSVTGCDHHCCHRGPFQVVFVGTELKKMFICTYSSDVGSWSEPISIDRPECSYEDTRGAYSPTVLLKNQLYFGIERTNAALRYDLETHEKSWIQLPKLDFDVHSSVLTTTEDGGLGLVRLSHGVLCIWGLRMDMDTTEKGNSGWTKFKVIDIGTKFKVTDLRRHLHVRQPSFNPGACVVGFADGLGLGVLFVTVNNALYTVDLETCKVVKRKQEYNGREIETAFPYMHFYNPDKQ